MKMLKKNNDKNKIEFTNMIDIIGIIGPNDENNQQHIHQI